MCYWYFVWPKLAAPPNIEYEEGYTDIPNDQKTAIMIHLIKVISEDRSILHDGTNYQRMDCLALLCEK